MEELQQPSLSQLKKADWACIPEELRVLKQWCFTSPSSPDPKAPLTRGRRLASSRKPDDWLTFEEACSLALDAQGDIGFMLTESDPYCCIDLDIKDDTPAEWLDRHELIVNDFDSYTEWSRSGRGRHIWVRGQVTQGTRRDGVEVYSQGRFMICTGRVAQARPIQPKQELLVLLMTQLRRTAPKLPDGDLQRDCDDADDHLYVASLAFDENGNPANNEYGRLFAGDWEGRYPSQSEADLALMVQMARFTASDQEVIKAFQLSALGKRPKAQRSDYLHRTVNEARSKLHAERESIEHGNRIANGLLSSQKPDGSGSFRVLTEDVSTPTQI